MGDYPCPKSKIVRYSPVVYKRAVVSWSWAGCYWCPNFMGFSWACLVVKMTNIHNEKYKRRGEPKPLSNSKVGRLKVNEGEAWVKYRTYLCPWVKAVLNTTYYDQTKRLRELWEPAGSVRYHSQARRTKTNFWCAECYIKAEAENRSKGYHKLNTWSVSVKCSHNRIHSPLPLF